MAGNEEPGQAGGRPKARDLNELIRYVMWSVFRVDGPDAIDDAAAAQDGPAWPPR